MERLAYLGQPNCYRLSNGTVELVVTTGIGPRVLRYGFVGEDNILGEVPGLITRTELGEWKPWGGHRLWAAPEAMPRSYAPDNGPIEHRPEGERAIRLVQPTDASGIQKEMAVALAADGTGVTLRHAISNRLPWAIEIAPWALTVVRGGGLAVLPQEPYCSHDECLRPARPLVVWHFTDLGDPRWSIGPKYICLRSDDRLAAPQKIGAANKQGWCAYHHGRTLFVKLFDYDEGARYPDYGSNNELYAAGSFMEVETLGPVGLLEPGASAAHVERWHLFGDVDVGASEAALDRALGPLIAGLRGS